MSPARIVVCVDGLTDGTLEHLGERVIHWQLPDLDMSEQAYRLAKDHFEATGRHILDATVGGKLSVLLKAQSDHLVGRRNG